MGRNFDDYPGFQPKITPPKHFSRQCSSHQMKNHTPHKMIPSTYEVDKNIYEIFCQNRMGQMTEVINNGQRIRV